MSTRIGPATGGFVPGAQPSVERVGRVDALRPVSPLMPAKPEGSHVPADQQDLADLAGRVNKAVAAINQSLRFEVGENSRIIIRVVDSVTNEVIKEIPPESLVKALKHLEKALGLLVDEKR